LTKKLPKHISINLPIWGRWLIIPVFFILTFFIYNTLYWGRIFPGIYVAGVYVGGLSSSQAQSKLQTELTVPKEVIFIYNDQVFRLPTEALGYKINYVLSAESAYGFGRERELLAGLYKRSAVPVQKVNLGLVYVLDRDSFDKNLGVISETISTDPVYPSVKFVNNSVVIEKGSPGTVLDKEAAFSQVNNNLSQAASDSILLSIKSVDPTINEIEAVNLKGRAQKLIGKKLILNSTTEVFEWKEDKLFLLLGPRGGQNQDGAISLISKIALSLNREPQNPTFIFLPLEGGGRVQEFSPSQDGLKVQEDKLLTMVVQGLDTLEATDQKEAALDIPLLSTPPKITTGDVNNLGIKELLGSGVSHFAHSISNRIFNISLASSKFKGVLVAPQEVFSFNDILGDVSSLTGYKQAFVIKDGKTVLGDGGGVCQVSSTLFRALLNAGLPIVERHAHSYRVGYYEQDSPPGMDATVYSPTADLKFRNDTPAHLLIQPIVDTKNTTLSFEIYGSKDGRLAKTTKPKVSGVTPPPEDLYIDEPTLPSGQVKQIDFKAWGAKVSFDYSVEKDGQITFQKTFVSNYRPWQAIYLRGTGPAQ